MIICTFLKPVSPYNEGERACFSLEEASKLMAAGAVTVVKDATTELESPAPVETATQHEPESPAATDPPKRRK